VRPEGWFLTTAGACLSLGGLVGFVFAHQGAKQDKQVTVLFENEHVLVRDLVLPPGARTGLHTHQRGELTYSFNDGTLRATAPGEPAQSDQRYAGRAHRRDVGFAHDVENVGAADYHALLIELKDQTPTRAQ
jgi:hypothetical protein